MNATNTTDVIAFTTNKVVNGRIALLMQKINLIWNFFTVVIVFSMQLGFIFLEVGASRRKHSRTVLLKNLVDTIITAFVFWAVGY